MSSSSTSSHLFDIILDYDVLQAWTCPQCPLPLSPNEHERLYDGINEVHIADGINMGTTAALKELETNEIFCEDKIEGPCGPVKGIYARERTFLALKVERLLIRTLVDTLDGEADAKKLGLACKRISAMKTKSHNLELVGQLLSRLKKVNVALSPGYKLLLDELWRCTPIAQLFPSNNKKNLRTFEAYLTKDNHCFDSFEGAKSLTESFPLPVRMIQQIHKEEGCVPSDVGMIFQEMINLKRAYSTLVQERAVPRIQPTPEHKEPVSEVWPGWPLHTLEYEYEVDKRRNDDEDDEDEKGCNKYYNECSTISGGITHVTCCHQITKGFTAMRKGESPLMALGK